MLKLITIIFVLTSGVEQRHETMVMTPINASCEQIAHDIGMKINEELESNPDEAAIVDSYRIECAQITEGEGAFKEPDVPVTPFEPSDNKLDEDYQNEFNKQLFGGSR